jgi:hypothetical protein
MGISLPLNRGRGRSGFVTIIRGNRFHKVSGFALQLPKATGRENSPMFRSNPKLDKLRLTIIRLARLELDGTVEL